MARPSSSASTTRLTDVAWGQMTQFVTRLHNAGLTGDDIKKLLDNPKLLNKVVDAAKSVLAEPVWGPGLYYCPTDTWNTIAPGVQMKRLDCCTRCRNSNQIKIRVGAESILGYNPAHMHWDAGTEYELTDAWSDVAPGVQIRKPHSLGGITVRTFKSS